MIVLGSTYLPMMRGIRSRLGPGIELRDFESSRALNDQLGDVDVLLLGHHRVGPAELRAAPRLRLIQQHGRGLDSVDVDAAQDADVKVANVPGGNSVAVAEHGLALMLALARNLHGCNKSISRRRTGEPMGLELRGKTVVLVGLGAAGTEFAQMATALKLRVLAIRSDIGKGAPVPLDFLGGPGHLSSILGEADFVVLLATLTPATAAMFDNHCFGLMKNSAFLINLGRAALVDRAALQSALERRAIAGAASDVFWNEPADPGDPLLALDNFLLTPHVAGFTDNSIAHIATEVALNIARLRNGEPLANLAGSEIKL